jgi:hypothetical protein
MMARPVGETTLRPATVAWWLHVKVSADDGADDVRPHDPAAAQQRASGPMAAAVTHLVERADPLLEARASQTLQWIRKPAARADGDGCDAVDPVAMR